MYRGYSSVALQELFEIDTSSKGTRGHSSKLKKVRCTRDVCILRARVQPTLDPYAEVFL